MSGRRLYVGRLNFRARESDLENFFGSYGKLREVMLKNGYCFVEFEDDRDAEDAVHDLNGKELLGDRVIVQHAKGTPRTGGGGGGGYDRDRRDGGGYNNYNRNGGGYNNYNRGGGGWGGGGGGGGYRQNNYGGDRGYGGGRNRGGGSSNFGPPSHTKYRVVVENLSSRVSWQDLKDYMRQAGEVTFADAHRYRKNEGVVEFSTRSDMEAALDKLDDTEINGRRIKLTADEKSKRRSRSYSRSRSRSGGKRSRSRSGSRKRSSRHRQSSSRSRSRSDSKSPQRKKSRSTSRQNSRSPKKNGDGDKRSASRSPARSGTPRSKSRSTSRSRSGSPN